MTRAVAMVTAILLMTMACVRLLGAQASTPGEPPAAVAAAPAAPSSADGEKASSPVPPERRLTEAWPSMDALLDDFLTALSNNDRIGLNRMSLSEEEYLGIIVPGTVPPGQPPRKNSEKVKEFFWKMANQKSHAYGDILLKRFWGRDYKRVRLEFTEGTKHYAWYDAHGEVRMVLEDKDKNLWNLETGFIVEVAGQFKFMGYNYD